MKRVYRSLLAVGIVISSLTGCLSMDAFEGDGDHVAEYRRELPRPELDDSLFSEQAK